MPDGDPIIIGSQTNTASSETRLSRNEVTNRTLFVARNLNNGGGIRADAMTGVALWGSSDSSYGVYASSNGGHGLRGDSTSGMGVFGYSRGTLPAISGLNGGGPGGGTGVEGVSGTGIGVRGSSSSNTGVAGDSLSGTGVAGSSNSRAGVEGFSSTSTGVRGISNSGPGVEGSGGISGVIGTSPNQVGVFGSSGTGTGVEGVSNTGVGVSGTSTGDIGVLGNGFRAGVKGESSRFGVHGRGLGLGGIGVFAEAGATALHAQTRDGIAIRGVAIRRGTQAAEFQGNVSVVNGNLTVVNGNKPFKIDHPLDPQNKYLLHNAVESPERKNLYDGVARLGEEGAAWVELPEWFEALNGDVRYQLTAVGGAAPGLHVAEELAEHRFKIAGGEAGMKVCWQLTGTRIDPWAAANPFQVEQDKPEAERGRYLDPSLYDAPEAQRIMLGPPIPEAVDEEQPPPALSGVDVADLEAERPRRLDEWRRLVEEQRRELQELRRRMQRHEEAPPDST